MNVIREINRINDRELELGLSGASWHDEYKDSAYVFCGGLPFDLTEGDVVTIFSQFGEIVDVNMPRDKETHKPRGFAFVMYEDQRSTVLAVDNLNGGTVLGRTIRVDHVRDYKQPGSKDGEGKFVAPEEPSMNALPPVLNGSDDSDDSSDDDSANGDADAEDPMAAYIRAERRAQKAITGGGGGEGSKKKRKDRAGETKDERRARKAAKRAKKEAKRASRTAGEHRNGHGHDGRGKGKQRERPSDVKSESREYEDLAAQFGEGRRVKREDAGSVTPPRAAGPSRDRERSPPRRIKREEEDARGHERHRDHREDRVRDRSREAYRTDGRDRRGERGGEHGDSRDERARDDRDRRERGASDRGGRYDAERDRPDARERDRREDRYARR